MKTPQTIEKKPHRQTPKVESLRKVLLENDQVMVIETSYPLGTGVPLHMHRFPHVLYVIEGGTVEVSDPEGAASVVEVEAGQAFWREAQRHSTRNIGLTPVRIVEVEIKSAPTGLAGERKPRTTTPADLKWTQDPLDPARKVALLAGDPTKPGPYTVRLHASAGYTLGLHVHPTEDENLTVLSGALHWSTGAEGSDAPEHVLPAGSFVCFPAGTPHRVWTTEDTELQMTGVGPRTYRYLKATQEPRVKPGAAL